MNFKFSKKLFVQLLFISSSILFLSSCNNDDDTTELVDQLKYETLDLSKFDLSDGTATAGGKIWSGTYKEDAELTSGIFKFKHYRIAFLSANTMLEIFSTDYSVRDIY